MVAWLLWLAAVWGYSIYLRTVPSFSMTYGSLGGIVGYAVLLYISAVLFIFGAEVNSVRATAAREPARGHRAPGALPAPRSHARMQRRADAATLGAAADDRSTPLMQGKKGLIMGIANDRSLAWGIAKAVHAHGAEVAVTYQGEALLKRVRPLAEQLGSELVLPADVTDPGQPGRAVRRRSRRKWGRLDFLVHAVAFSDKEELKGRYLNTSLENFQRTMLISCFSFTDLARRAEPLMTDGGSLVTLSYIGAEKVTPHYNVMGVAKAASRRRCAISPSTSAQGNIRVNAISAGPVKTLAASGIGDFRYILKWNEYNAPLKRNTTHRGRGRAGVYLLSAWAPAPPARSCTSIRATTWSA